MLVPPNISHKSPMSKEDWDWDALANSTLYLRKQGPKIVLPTAAAVSCCCNSEHAQLCKLLAMFTVTNWCALVSVQFCTVSGKWPLHPNWVCSLCLFRYWISTVPFPFHLQENHYCIAAGSLLVQVKGAELKSRITMPVLWNTQPFILLKKSFSCSTIVTFLNGRVQKNSFARIRTSGSYDILSVDLCNIVA